MIRQENKMKKQKQFVVVSILVALVYIATSTVMEEIFLARHEAEYNEDIIQQHNTGSANNDNADNLHETANASSTMQGTAQKTKSKQGGNVSGFTKKNNKTEINTTQVNNNDVEAEAEADLVKAEADVELDELTTTAKAPAGDNNDVYIDAFPDLSSINDIKTYDNLTSLVNLDIPVPNNLNILFMGDSVSRYQYLDLVYFLSHGTWVEPGALPSMVYQRRNHSSWNSFYDFTNSNLNPYEECDCFRTEGRVNMTNFIENRYFMDVERNNTLSFLWKGGNEQFKTSWNATDIHKNHTLVKDASDVSYFGHADWLGTIEEFVCKMDPRPSMVVMNSGHWGDGGFANATIQEMVVDALRGCDIASVYKTTTKKKNEKNSVMRDYEQQMCNQTDMCYDTGWTGPLVSREFYWDRLHLHAPIYSMLNVQLLSMLSSRRQKVTF